MVRADKVIFSLKCIKNSKNEMCDYEHWCVMYNTLICLYCTLVICRSKFEPNRLMWEIMITVCPPYFKEFSFRESSVSIQQWLYTRLIQFACHPVSITTSNQMLCCKRHRGVPTSSTRQLWRAITLTHSIISR